MPALTAPPPRDQVSTRDADRFELCGEACVASALGVDVEGVVTWLRQHEGGERAVHNGTGPQVLIDFCTSRGIGALLASGPAVQYVAGAIARAHYALVAVWSDHLGNPIPQNQSARLHPGGIGHWLLAYGIDGSSIAVMQPWGGRFVQYNLGGGRDQQLGVEINQQVGARPNSSTPSGPTRVYVVKSGDTLSAIAEAQGVTLQQLVAANPQIKNPNLIFPGQQVTIVSSAKY